MDVTNIISHAFNNAVDIDNTWFILAIPFFIRYIFSSFLTFSYVSDLIQMLVGIVILGLFYEIISHLLEGNDKLIKPDFSIYNIDLIVNGIKSFLMLLVFIILAAVLFSVFISIGSLTHDTVITVVVILISAIIFAILLTLSGLILAHGINTNSYNDGIRRIPNIVTSIGLGNIILFMFVNLIILIGGAVIVGFFTIIPFIGSIIGNSIVSAAFSFYFVLASTYMYKEYVLDNRNDFNENSYNKILGYPKTNYTVEE